MAAQQGTRNEPMSSDRQPPTDAGADGYVLPPPQRRPREGAGVVAAQAAACRGSEPARALAARVACEAEILHLLLAELRDRLERLDGATAEASRAQLKGAVRELGAVLDWCEAVQGELLDEARAIAGEVGSARSMRDAVFVAR